MAKCISNFYSNTNLFWPINKTAGVVSRHPPQIRTEKGQDLDHFNVSPYCLRSGYELIVLLPICSFLKVIPHIIDEFEGFNSRKKWRYERMIFFHFLHYKRNCVNLIVERSKLRKFAGETTLANLKKETANGSGEISDFLRSYLKKKQSRGLLYPGADFRFKTPFRLHVRTSYKQGALGLRYRTKAEYDIVGVQFGRLPWGDPMEAAKKEI